MKDTFDWRDVIQEFFDEFCDAAQEVGIDGETLSNNLPQSGQLLSGNRVPVTSAKYRGKCSVVFYINRLENGNTWPYLKFCTFKHGGQSTFFNGLELIKKKPNNKFKSKRSSPSLPRQNNQNDEMEQWRKDQFWHSSEQYFKGNDPNDSGWVKKRFNGLMTASCLARTGLRLTENGDLLAPISHKVNGLIGYHKIFDDKENKKRHHIIQAGLLKGSAIFIKENQNIKNPTIGIAEGLATALSIALVWSGVIYVALTAWNLAAVRNTLQSDQKVTFFADNDSWKPDVGNTGIEKAKNAALPVDEVIFPVFNQQSLANKPTDFNDLLLLEGLDVLSAQVNQR